MLIEPEFPCRIMETRSCPDIYMGICGERPCARYESDHPEPWLGHGSLSERVKRMAETGERGIEIPTSRDLA